MACGVAEISRQLPVTTGEQQRRLEEWEHAVTMFNGGNYRAALHDFYRIEGDDPERIARCKRNGWYNLALQSLEYGDCRSAVDHFQEAREIDPNDEGVSDALALALECRDGGFTQQVRLAVEEFTTRGLDD